MSQCCSSSHTANKTPEKHICPVNGNRYSSVPQSTILLHINNPWAWHNKSQAYYFCDDPECEVVYFGKDNSILEKSQMRTTVGIKEKLNNSLICYCYGVTLKEATNNTNIKEFVIQQTKQHSCACESRNPSGKCCLKDFPGKKSLTGKLTQTKNS
ncbi:MAG: hypothetical protein OQK98_04165 [Gammaproteobacteria bacterium]|nr:hypothetical protein [Gammaproteobacteria bacterium]